MAASAVCRIIGKLHAALPDELQPEHDVHLPGCFEHDEAAAGIRGSCGRRIDASKSMEGARGLMNDGSSCERAPSQRISDFSRDTSAVSLHATLGRRPKATCQFSAKVPLPFAVQRHRL